MKQNKVHSKSLSLYDLDGLTIKAIIKYLEEFQEKIDQSATFDFSCPSGDYDAVFYWTKEETDDEYNARLDKEYQSKQQTEEQEKRLYEQLKAKYEKRKNNAS